MNNKRFLKALGLLLVVALLAAALPLQAKAQTGGNTLYVAEWSEPATTGVAGRETVLFDGTNYHMWYYNSTARKLYYTYSTTPDSFDTGTEVTFTGDAPVEKNSISVVKEGSTFYMIAYGGVESEFAYYTSTEGTTWTKGSVVFDGTGMVDYFVKIDAPFLFKIDTGYRLYFQVKTGSGDTERYNIYAAESGTIGGTYTLVNEGDPVLSPDTDTTKWDGKYVMHPWVVKDGDVYYMWYSAHNGTDPHRLGMAKSTDGLNWVKSPANPILPDPTAGYAEPSVIKDGNTWRMWLIARTGDGVVYYDAKGPFEFQSIQDAIDAASPGDTILVAQGTYEENLTIRKPLTLKAAASGVVIEKSDADPLIKITSQDVNLVGLTLKGATAVEVDTRPEELRQESLMATAHWNIEYCSFVDNDINIKNLTDFQVMAENNWWGAATGPEPGSIIGDVDYIPWLRISGLALDVSEIEENKPAGTLVGTFEITDPEEDNVYELTLENSALYPDNALFTIDGYDLKTKAGLNYEEKTTYTIYVRVTDAWDNIWEGEFDIAVIDINDAPVLELEFPEDYEGEIDELVPFTFTATATDEDTDEDWNELVFSLEGAPVGANISNEEGTKGKFTWTPTEAQGPGEYTFDVCVSDSELEDCETITITVNEVNVAPVANDDAYNVLKGTKLVVPAPGVLGNDTDADLPENTLSAVVVLPPVDGDLVLNSDGSFEFTPPASAATSYEFTYKVSDGAGKESGLATVTLTIKDNNLAPTAITFTPRTGGIVENVDYDYLGTLKANDDVDLDDPSVQHSFSLIGDYDDNAYFDIEYDKLIAKEPLDFEAKPLGQYTVYVRATDFFGRSIDQQVVITVNDANDAPVLTLPADIPTERDEALLEALTFTATATDEDTDEDWNELVFSLADGEEGEVPDEAEIHPVSGKFTWTPSEAQGPGEYTFDVCVWDGGEVGEGLSDCETITITVNEVNVAPVLVEIGDKEVDELETLEFVAEATDADIPVQTLVFSLADGEDGEVPEGAVITAAGAFSWTPSEAQGPDEYTFDVCVSDGVADPVCETITITVAEVNEDPVANPDFYAVTGNQLVVPAPGVLANDTDADIPENTLTVELVTDSDPDGLVLYSNGSFAYTKPASETAEAVTFEYEIYEDGVASGEKAIVTLLLKNYPPEGITLAPAEIEENEKFVGELTTDDPNNDPIVTDVHTYSFVDTCEGGALDNDAFTIGKNDDGDDVLMANERFDYETKNSYSVCVRSTDLFGERVDEKLDIRVIDVNEAPRAVPQPDLTTIVNTPLEITLAGDDPEGSELTYAIFSEPKHGTLVATELLSINFADNGVLKVIENTVTYKPADGFVGEDSFTFKVMDATGLVSELATVTITVNEANKPPVAEDISVETMENQPVEIELLATDPDDDPLTFEIVSGPEHGTLECEGSLCTYTPSAGWSGTDFFTYIANDGELDSNEATVEITVHPLPVFRIYLPLILK